MLFFALMVLQEVAGCPCSECKLALSTYILNPAHFGWEKGSPELTLFALLFVEALPRRLFASAPVNGWTPFGIGHDVVHGCRLHAQWLGEVPPCDPRHS